MTDCCYVEGCTRPLGEQSRRLYCGGILGGPFYVRSELCDEHFFLAECSWEALAAKELMRHYVERLATRRDQKRKAGKK